MTALSGGRLATREAVAEFLTAAAIEGVGTVYPARPEIVNEQDYQSDEEYQQAWKAYEGHRMAEAAEAAGGAGAVLVVNITKDKRKREALAGRGAVNDSWVFDVALEVFFADSSGEGVPAQLAYDTIIDQVIEAIRANPVLGAPQTVLSAGEFDAGVEHTQAQPYTDAEGLTVMIFGVVTFASYSWVAGSV